MQVNVARIRGLMAEHGDTLGDLARKLNISYATLSHYINGRTEMRVNTVAQIAEIYKVSPISLLKIEE